MSQAKKDFAHTLLVDRLVAKFAGEFTPAEWEAHKKEHPGADIKDHTITKPEGGDTKEKPKEKAEGDSKAEGKPKRKQLTELEQLRDTVANPKDWGLDPKDPEDKKLIENAKKQLEKIESKRGEGAPTKKEREEGKPKRKQVMVHDTTADSLYRHYIKKTPNHDLSSWTGGRKNNPVSTLVNKVVKKQPVDHELIHEALSHVKKQRAGEGRESARKELDHVIKTLNHLAGQLKNL